MKINQAVKGLAVSALLAGVVNAAVLSEPKVSFQGYKTPNMVGTAGGFAKAKFSFGKGESVVSQLSGASAFFSPADIDMGADAITDNIVKVFFKALNGGKNFKVEIVSVAGGEAKGVASAKVTIGKQSALVPLTYEVANGELNAKGQLDLNAFANAQKALKALSDAAAGHQGLSWPLVDLTFNAKVK